MQKAKDNAGDEDIKIVLTETGRIESGVGAAKAHSYLKHVCCIGLKINVEAAPPDCGVSHWRLGTFQAVRFGMSEYHNQLFVGSESTTPWSPWIRYILLESISYRGNVRWNVDCKAHSHIYQGGGGRGGLCSLPHHRHSRPLVARRFLLSYRHCCSLRPELYDFSVNKVRPTWMQTVPSPKSHIGHITGRWSYSISRSSSIHDSRTSRPVFPIIELQVYTRIAILNSYGRHHCALPYRIVGQAVGVTSVSPVS